MENAKALPLVAPASKPNIGRLLRKAVTAVVLAPVFILGALVIGAIVWVERDTPIEEW